MDINGLRDFNQTLAVRGIATSSVASNKTVNVNFLGTIIKCRAGRGLSISAGDIVIAFRQGLELIVLERLHAAAPGADTADPGSVYPPNPWGSVQSGQTVIHPVETRSYRDDLGWRKDTDDAFQGNWGGHNHAGCAFYGKKPRSLAGAEVLSAKLKVKRDPGSQWSTNEPATLKRITQNALTKAMVKDKTGPDFASGTQDIPKLSPREAINYTLPKSWGQDLVDGTVGGLAVHTNTNDPKARLEGRGSWGPAFTVTLTWRRVI